MTRHIRVGFAPHRTWCKVEPSGADLTEGQDDSKPSAQACRACRRARADDAARMLVDLASALEQPAPLEDCPFSLTAPKPKRITRATQPELF